jgi:hypothetical protein
MPKEKDQILHIRVEADFWEKIDAWRKTVEPIEPNRSDAVRYLINLGLKASAASRKTRKSE